MDIFHRYEHAINWIVSLCPQPDKFAHTYAGLGIWLLTGLISRKPLSSLWSLLPVVVLELANEAMDRVAHGAWQGRDTVRDMAATWFWPFVLCFCLRAFPGLSRRASRQSPHLATPSENHVDGARAAVPAMRTADRDNIGRELTGGEPV
ncbi:hypothetical protein [Novosphingobium malaysiense]|uniref:hypothetical protein n=1 Tax=Novosphingobium malaysiense TaxID=1348853 RepID=UPI0012E08820|nr:hypothetical protein [Novosphingobium malaysiense]